jgi:hypothetical protein
LQEEGLSFLTQRGTNIPEGREYTGRRNIPVLLLPDRKILNAKPAREYYGAKSFVARPFRTRFEACKVKDALQNLIHGDVLGHRLHRHVAKSPKLLPNDYAVIDVIIKCFPIENPSKGNILTLRTIPPKTLHAVP